MFAPGTENGTSSYVNIVPEVPTPAPTHVGEEINDGRPVQPPRTVDVEAIMEEARLAGVRKGRSAEEIEIMVQTAARYLPGSRTYLVSNFLTHDRKRQYSPMIIDRASWHSLEISHHHSSSWFSHRIDLARMPDEEE